ncbi:MAG: response regulator transcription factor [Chloroflexota bacterium]
MLDLLIIAQESKTREELRAGLVQKGFTCSTASLSERVIEQVARQSPALIIFEMDSNRSASGTAEIFRRIKQERQLPVIALITGEILDNNDSYLDMIDDFVVQPYDLREVSVRIKRLLQDTKRTDDGTLITCSDLLINQAKCEVTLCGRVIMLTFMEYQLLKFLAGNKGRVFTRDALLDKVWGYDYYGGDRTVDVHIRRLRSKIEDPSHSFIETVRNIGYKFKEDNIA